VGRKSTLLRVQCSARFYFRQWLTLCPEITLVSAVYYNGLGNLKIVTQLKKLVHIVSPGSKSKSRRCGGTCRFPSLSGSNSKPGNITRKKPAACLLKNSIFFNMIYSAVAAELLPVGFLLDFFPENGGNMTTQKNVYFIVTAV
jgi:hypothetical protein